MFENSGAKLKKVAEIKFFVEIILCLLYVLISLVNMMNSGSNTLHGSAAKLDVVLFIFIIIFFLIYSFVSSLLLYAFGELVTNTETIRLAVRKNMRHE